MAKDLAREVGYVYVDTGAMYRSVTLYALRHNLFNEDGSVKTDELEKEMLQAADELDFERAAQLRDRIEAMREKVGQHTTVFQFDLEEKKKRGRRGRRGGDSNRARIPKPER
jgi:cytidylate kinase